MRWFGRDPAVILSIVAAVLSCAVAFKMPVTEAMSAGIMALLYAGSDFLAALVVKSDKQLPTLLAFAEAGLALLMVFGIHMSTEQTSAIMGLVTVAAGAFIRTQVDAPLAKVRSIT